MTLPLEMVETAFQPQGCSMWLGTSLNRCPTNLTLTTAIHNYPGSLSVIVLSVVGTGGPHCPGEDPTAQGRIPLLGEALASQKTLKGCSTL